MGEHEGDEEDRAAGPNLLFHMRKSEKKGERTSINPRVQTTAKEEEESEAKRSTRPSEKPCGNTDRSPRTKRSSIPMTDRHQRDRAKPRAEARVATFATLRERAAVRRRGL